MRWRPVLLLVALAVIAFAIWYSLGRGVTSGRGGARGERPPVAGDRANAAAGVRGSEVSSAKDQVGGRVIDEDGLPVEGGSVVLSCLDSQPPGRLIRGGAVRIGEAGEFEGPGCKGRVCAQLRHAAMIQDEPWLLRAGQPAQLRAHMLDRVEGTVLDPTGEPAPGVHLVMVPPPDDEDPTALPPFVSRTASTDVDGHFSFAKLERPACDACGEASGRCDPEQERELPTYTRMLLTARAEGHRMVETMVDATEVEPIELRLVAGAPPLRIELADPDGRPYPRARVLARSRDRSYEQHAISSADGQFVFEELGDGDYDLRAIQDGVELAHHEGVSAGANIVLDGTVGAAGPDLVVSVIAADGHPVADAIVAGGPFVSGRTDALGEARVANVMPGPYVVRVRGVGIRAFSREITVPESDTPYRVSLRAPGR